MVGSQGKSKTLPVFYYVSLVGGGWCSLIMVVTVSLPYLTSCSNGIASFSAIDALFYTGLGCSTLVPFNLFIFHENPPKTNILSSSFKSRLSFLSIVGFFPV